MGNLIYTLILFIAFTFYSCFTFAQGRDLNVFKHKYSFKKVHEENTIKITTSNSDTTQICFSLKNIFGQNIQGASLKVLKQKYFLRKSQDKDLMYEFYLMDNDSINCSVISDGVYDVLPGAGCYRFKLFKLKLRENQTAMLEITARYLGTAIYTVYSKSKLSRLKVKQAVECWNNDGDLKQICEECVVEINSQ